jgi:hypothetical protein
MRRQLVISRWCISWQDVNLEIAENAVSEELYAGFWFIGKPQWGMFHDWYDGPMHCFWIGYFTIGSFHRDWQCPKCLVRAPNNGTDF